MTSPRTLRTRLCIASTAALFAPLCLPAQSQYGPPAPTTFTWHPDRVCSTAVGAAWCISASTWSGSATCCDYCTAPKTERQCSASGNGCTQVVYSQGPASCGVFMTCGTMNALGNCTGGVATSNCLRRYCN